MVLARVVLAGVMEAVLPGVVGNEVAGLSTPKALGHTSLPHVVLVHPIEAARHEAQLHISKQLNVLTCNMHKR